jgi:type VI secretion system protein ImpA
MPTEPLLPFDELLAPIPGDDPAGEGVSFAVRAELEEARKEIDPSDFDADDPLRPSEAKKADWKGIVTLTTRTLKESSKDLLLAARLTEALTKLHGYAGFNDGIELMRRMIEECWDRLHPTIEDGDLEVRAGPFNWLGDDGRGARFPYTLRCVPLFNNGAAAYNLRDWKNIQEGKKAGISRDDFERAINAATREQCQALVDDLTRAIDEMTKLLASLEGRLGSAAPGMMDVRAALSEALVLAKQALARKPPAAEAQAPTSEAEAGSAASAATGAAPARAMATRADIYARLSAAADLLAQMEPHSPVPYLIRRAVELGRMPFPEMMKALMREEFKNALAEMNRELGIKEGEAQAQAQQQQPGW